MSKNYLSSSSFKDAFNNLENFDNLENFADDKVQINGYLTTASTAEVRDDTTNNQYFCAELGLPVGYHPKAFERISDGTSINLYCDDNKGYGTIQCYEPNSNSPTNCCYDYTDEYGGMYIKKINTGLECSGKPPPDAIIPDKYICTNDDNDVCYKDKSDIKCTTREHVPLDIKEDDIFTRIKYYTHGECHEDNCHETATVRRNDDVEKDRWIDKTELSVCNLTNQNFTSWWGMMRDGTGIAWYPYLPDGTINPTYPKSVCSVVNLPNSCTVRGDDVQGNTFDNTGESCYFIGVRGKPKGIKAEYYSGYSTEKCKGDPNWTVYGNWDYAGPGFTSTPSQLWLREVSCSQKFSVDKLLNPNACDTPTNYKWDKKSSTCEPDSWGTFTSKNDCIHAHSPPSPPPPSF